MIFKPGMKRKLFFFIAVILAGCSDIKYAETSQHYWRPVDNNVFTYKKHGFHYNGDILDTTKIYCFAYPVDTPKYFECYRFFANGRLLSYRFFGHIDTSALADINVGSTGYYHIVNNVIRLQQFTVYAEHFKAGGCGTLIHHYGIIAKDYIALDMGYVLSKRYNYKPKLKGILTAKEASYTKYQKTNIRAPALKTNW